MSLVADLENVYSHPPPGSIVEFPSTRRFVQFSHRIFNRYPARSISLVPRAIIARMRTTYSALQRAGRVLDPFMGSGTTAVEACLQGMDAYGVEIDPFARMITEVRVHRASIDQLRALKRKFADVIKRYNTIDPDDTLRPQLSNVEYWFAQRQFEDLLRLKTAIYELTPPRTFQRKFLLATFADIVRPCSKAERQTLKPYISRKFTKVPADVVATFTKSFAVHLAAARDFSAACQGTGGITWIGTDGSNFSRPSLQIDAAISSPPYLNALDYVRCIKFESTWCGCATETDLSKLRLGHLGDPNRRVAGAISNLPRGTARTVIKQITANDPLRGSIVAGYFSDMLRNLTCVYSVLRHGGEYHLIIGDSVIRNINVSTHLIIVELARLVGFDLVGKYRYQIKDHRTSIPRNGNGGKIQHENVISLRK